MSDSNETTTLGKAVMIVGVFMLAIVIVAVAAFMLGQSSAHSSEGTVAPAIPNAVAVATPSPYPYVLTFTVLSTTTSNGFYEAMTTTGQRVAVSDYYTWNSMYPRDVYTGTVTGQNGMVYLMTDVHLISRYQWTENPDSYWGSHGTSLYDSRSKYDMYEYRGREGRDRSDRVDTGRRLRW